MGKLSGIRALKSVPRAFRRPVHRKELQMTFWHSHGRSVARGRKKN